MTHTRRWQESVRELSRHFPPSGARLRVLIAVVGKNQEPGDLASILGNLRPDLDIAIGERFSETSILSPSDRLDAIIVCNLWQLPSENCHTFLVGALRVLRPGGRLLLLDHMPRTGLLNLLKSSATTIALESAASTLS